MSEQATQIETATEQAPKAAPVIKASPLSSPEIGEIVGALALASLKFKPLLKESVNPHFGSKFADLAACIGAVRDALAEQGIVVIQPMCVRGHECFLRTMLAHKSGQFLGSEVPIVTGWENPQKLGSTLTYLRRYSLCALLDIAADADDDGNEAVGRQQPPREAYRPQNGSAGGSAQRPAATQNAAPRSTQATYQQRGAATATQARPATRPATREPGSDDEY